MRPDDNGRNFLKAKAILTSPIPASAVLVAFWLAGTCYNLFKPFHIDDTAHLEIARWIAAHPLHPVSGSSSSRATLYIGRYPTYRASLSTARTANPSALAISSAPRAMLAFTPLSRSKVLGS